MIKNFIFTLLLVLNLTIISMGSRASGSVVLVGQGCSSFSTISSAVQDSASYDDIRIVGESTFFENIVITRSLKITGGFETCADAMSSNVSPSTKPTINGSAIDSVIKIVPSNEPVNVEIENLDVENGLGFIENGLLEGGGLSIWGRPKVTLRNVRVKDSSSIIGGGILIYGAEDVSLELYNSFIMNNNSGNGGGLFCTGENWVMLDELSGIYSNSASSLNADGAGNGGGVIIAGGCELLSYAGTSNSNPLGGIRQNKANGDVQGNGGNGGGLYVTGAAKAVFYGGQVCENDFSNSCVGDLDKTVTFFQNEAVGNGGAIFATDTNSSVTLDHVDLYLNKANEGGVFYATVAAEVLVGKGLYEVDSNNFTKNNPLCATVEECSFIRNNSANSGAVAYAGQSGSVRIDNTKIKSNRADTGVIGYLQGTGELVFNQSLIVENGDADSATFNDDWGFFISTNSPGFSDLVIRNTTIAKNEFRKDVIYNFNGDVSLFGSLFSNDALPIYFDDDSVSSASDPRLSGECLVVDEWDSIINNDTGTINNELYFAISDIGLVFKDYEAGDYQLFQGSLATDVCTRGFVYSSDIIGNPKGVDNPFDPNGLNKKFDAGAYEYIDDDIIFLNRFE